MPLTIGMVAHDSRKPALAAWAEQHAALIAPHAIVATATTGGILSQTLPDLAVRTVKSRSKSVV